jgi:hypothetical protein
MEQVAQKDILPSTSQCAQGTYDIRKKPGSNKNGKAGEYY